MSDWTAGYVADIGYTFGYYPELNPLRVKLAFLNARLAWPEMGAACELGFGQGVSANMHATASLTTWHGTDFNPAQASLAQEMARASGAAAHLHDDAFADFCTRTDLPEFDYIGLHGIWSWISDANRAVIVDFVRRKLKVGGVLYISYNTLPGWATFAPIRHMLTQHANSLSATGEGVLNQVANALGFAEKVLATKPLYAQMNPSVTDRLSKVKDQNRHYLAHEYFNADWHPMYFADMVKWMSPAKVTFACSAHLLDHVPVLDIRTDQQELLKSIPDANLRETVRDFMVNQQFRKDYWVKGARKMSAMDQAEHQRALKVVLLAPRNSVSLKINTALGEANMNEAVYVPLLDLLADHKPRTLADLEQGLKDQVSFPQILQAVMVLSGTGYLALAQEETVVHKAKRACDKLNAFLMHKARGTADINYLVSPVTGGGIPVPRFAQLFLLARSLGGKKPADWAAHAWALLSAQRELLLKDGRTLQTDEENLAELTDQAQTFADKQLPILKALQIA